jgi:hypothetical protein
MSKKIAIPCCWVVYKTSDEVFAVLGAAVTTPPAIVLEVLAMEGKAKRVSVIHTLEVEGEDGHEHELDSDDEDEAEEGPSSPFFGSKDED